MKLCNIGHNFDYELEKLIRLFLPFEKIEVLHSNENGDNCAVCEIAEIGGEIFATATLNLNGKFAERSSAVDKTAEDIKKESQHEIARQLFYCFYVWYYLYRKRLKFQLITVKLKYGLQKSKFLIQ